MSKRLKKKLYKKQNGHNPPYGSYLILDRGEVVMAEPSWAEAFRRLPAIINDICESIRAWAEHVVELLSSYSEGVDGYGKTTNSD